MSYMLLDAGNAVGSTPVLAADLEKIFSLDLQFLVDAGIMACAMLLLFTLLSYLLFNPARELLAKRQAKIDEDLRNAEQEKKDAIKLKADYDKKLGNADKEAEQILSESRKKAMKRETDIVNDAKEEASRIISQANKEAELEKSKMKDEVKKEMVAVAAAMAGKFVSSSIDESKQDALIDETLKEMGDSTWQS